MAAVNTLDLPCRNNILIMVTPGENNEDGEGADRACDDHPPDMPDQRKAHHGGKERTDEAGRRIARDLNIPILRCFVGPALPGRTLLDLPVGVFAGYLRQECKIE